VTFSPQKIVPQAVTLDGLRFSAEQGLKRPVSVAYRKSTAEPVKMRRKLAQ
jgi:hypothetical protein